MKTFLFGIALALLAGAFSTPSSSAHGAGWQGPGDTVPKFPGKPIGPVVGGSPYAGPGQPAPASPGSPGSPALPGAGASPASPSAPVSGAPSASSPGSISSADLSNWSYWWYFNREGLLDLRRRFNAAGTTTGRVVDKSIPTRPSDKALKNTVLPALFEMVAEDQQDNMRLSSGIALARIATPEGARILETLRGLVRERDPNLREGGALALGINGDPLVIESLSTILTGGKSAKRLLGFKPNDRMRAFAAYGLALVADRATNDDIRRVVLRPVLAHFLDTQERTDLRVALAAALGMVRIDFGPTETSKAPRTKGKPTQPRYRRELITRLWEAYDEERDPLVRGHLPTTLARLIKDAPEDVRADGIARFLSILEDDPRHWELYGVLSSLGIIGQAWGQPIDQELRSALYAQATKQRESHARHLALMALAEVVTNSGPSLPPESVQKEFEDFLLARFEDGRSTDRPWIAMAAGSFGARLRRPIPGRTGARAKGRVGGELVEQLRATVREAGSPDELSASVLALGLIQDVAASGDVEHLLDTTSSKAVRGYAALSLGLLGRTSAYDKLALLIDDLRLEPISLEHAAMGLALLDRAKGSAFLRERLAGAYNGITAAPLAAAIGRVSDGASILALARLAREQDQTLSTREYACIALGLISDRDDLSWRSRLADNVNYAAWSPTLFDSAGKGVLNIF